MSNTKLKQKALEIAIKELGIQEATGHNDGERIRQYQDVVGHWARNQPWCASFVSWAYKKASEELKQPMPFAPQASVYILVQGVRKHTPNAYKPASKTFKPEPGDVFLSLQSDSNKNHTGLVWKVEGEYFHTIEGNRGDKVTTRKLALYGGEVTAYIHL